MLTVAANAYELNNLDNEALDAPIFTMTGSTATSSHIAGKHQTINGADRASTVSSDFASLPCQSVLVAGKKSESVDGVGLSRLSDAAEFEPIRNHPMYQSAHAQSMRGQMAMGGGRQITDDVAADADCVDGGSRSGGK